jgi:hypothetical protein
MGRKNFNSVKGREGGRKNSKRTSFEAIEGKDLFISINEDARIFGRVKGGYHG